MSFALNRDWGLQVAGKQPNPYIVRPPDQPKLCINFKSIIPNLIMEYSFIEQRDFMKSAFS